MKQMKKNDRPWFDSYAKGIPRTIKYEDTPIHEAFRRTVEKFPTHPALIFMGKIIKYRELGELVNRFASALAAMGVKPGDKVAMLLPNMPQIVIASYGAWRAGAVVVMNNPLYTDTELEHQLNNSESTVLVTMDLLAPRMIALKPKTQVKKIVVAHIRDHLGFPKKQLLPIVAKDKHRNIPPTPDVYEWLDLLKKYPSKDPGIKVAFDSLATLQYTGGTTGVSKGVMLTHSNLSCNLQQVKAWFPDIKMGEFIELGALPIFHSFGLTAVMNLTIRMAGSNVLIPRPEALTLLQNIQKHKVNFFPAVPTMYVGILNHPDLKKYNLSSINGCFLRRGAPPGGSDQAVRGARRGADLRGIRPVRDEPHRLHQSLGRQGEARLHRSSLPGTDFRIVDLVDGTKDMPAGEPGEVIIQGPQVTKGYYKMPDETAKTVQDGWLYTGDIGTMDEEGYFFIVDRKKDMIIAGGFNIYPRDIDEVLFEHPKIGLRHRCPDDYRGETVKAFVVMKPGETTEEESSNTARRSSRSTRCPPRSSSSTPCRRAGWERY